MAERGGAVGIKDRIREAQAKAKADREAAQAARVEQQRVADAARAEDARLAAEREAAASEARARARGREILGAELADFDVSTPEDAKVAVKLARLRKTEIAAEKRELAAELADVREQWRERQAGRIVTTGLGRGTGGRMVRGAIQANRRSERMSHAEVVNEFSDRKQLLDQASAYLDRVIVGLQRDWVTGGTAKAPPAPKAATAAPTGEDPMVVLTALGAMRDQGLITPDEYEAKRAEVIARI